MYPLIVPELTSNYLLVNSYSTQLYTSIIYIYVYYLHKRANRQYKLFIVIGCDHKTNLSLAFSLSTHKCIHTYILNMIIPFTFDLTKLFNCIRSSYHQDYYYYSIAINVQLKTKGQLFLHYRYLSIEIKTLYIVCNMLSFINIGDYELLTILIQITFYYITLT